MQTEAKADKGKEQEGRSPASRISGAKPLAEKIFTVAATACLATGLVLGNAKCGGIALDQDANETDVTEDDGVRPDVNDDALDVPDEGTDVEETADVPDEGIEPDVVPDEGTDVEETADVPEVESDVTADEAETGEAGVVCEGVHDETIRTYTLVVGVPTEIGNYNVTVTGDNPTGTGVLVDVECVSGGTVASGEDFVFHAERAIDRTNPEERERLRATMLSRTGDLVTCMAAVEPI